ncbi:ketopantoate reductase family protein [Streptomyces sp. NBC_00083]|uniref:ketopantoate reductase family protein n=1 Tax=Streptomyces sp. NBC_00083 TaxID=2975647 RepID=UPI002254443B|nr:2-dehydropantoate 2-reductase [Streptomyces sp. NBC_00083]MCX5387278.1 2-dehydropantoate 2-reductase [Streptomyces sp. NBC_00083]
MTSPSTTAADSARIPSSGVKVAVLGPGGIGGLLAALLSRAGHRVICIAGEATAEALRHDGIRVRSEQFGDFTAGVEADTALREPVDLCLVTVKQNALDAALDRTPPHFLDGGIVLPLLNGIEHMSTLRAHYGAEGVVAGVIRVESTRIAPGVIEHGSPFLDIDLAPTGATEAVAPLAALLNAVGANTRVVGGETAVLWGKLAFLAPFALLTTRYRLPIGAIRTERRQELEALVEETVAVSSAAGGPGDAAHVLSRYDAFPPGSKSSMLRDAEAGRPLELDAIGGALLRAGERLGIPTPLTTRLMSELRAD